MRNYWHKDFPHALGCGLFKFETECTCHIRRIHELEVRVDELEAQLEACRGEIGHLQAQLRQEND